MYAVLTEESFTRLCSNTKSTMDDKDSPCPHAHNRISNSAIIIVSLLSDLYVCIQVKKMASLMKQEFFSDLFKPLQTCERVLGWCTGQCKMLPFCVKTIVKESHNLELARLKKKKKKKKKRKKKKNILAISFGDFMVQYFHDALRATRRVVGHKMNGTLL